jgi:hypothetical protein
MSGLGSSSSLASVWTEGSHITAFRKQQKQELQLRLAHEVQQRFYSGAAVCMASFDIAITAYPAEETGAQHQQNILSSRRVIWGRS